MHLPVVEIRNSARISDISLLDVVTLHCKCNNLDSDEAMKEIQLYKNRKDSFDRSEVIRAAKKLKP
ncbi:hypothetical protein PIB30_087768, partial [Stylosanthes scabra]|nr:hypothetical protein [Stylosanthes scabra]